MATSLPQAAPTSAVGINTPNETFRPKVAHDSK